MPRCKVDPALQDQVHRFISDSGLTTNGAAVNLGINRATFWRFCDTGKASPRTKQQLRNALEKRNRCATESVSVDSDVPAAQVPIAVQLLADRELDQIKRACEGVLALISAYKAQRAGKEEVDRLPVL